MELIGKYISVISRQIQMSATQKFEHLNIGAGQYPVLLCVAKYPNSNQDRISRILNLDKATTTKAIRKLMNEGYLERKRDPEDHRAFLVNLTKTGAAQVPRIFDELAHITREICSPLDSGEYAELLGLLKKIFVHICDKRCTQE